MANLPFQEFPLSPDSPGYMIDHPALWPDEVPTPTKDELIQKMRHALHQAHTRSVFGISNRRFGDEFEGVL